MTKKLITIVILIGTLLLGTSYAAEYSEADKTTACSMLMTDLTTYYHYTNLKTVAEQAQLKLRVSVLTPLDKCTVDTRGENPKIKVVYTVGTYSEYEVKPKCGPNHKPECDEPKTSCTYKQEVFTVSKVRGQPAELIWHEVQIDEYQMKVCIPHVNS